MKTGKTTIGEIRRPLKIVAFLLTVTMLITMFPVLMPELWADGGDGDFNITLSWNNYESPDGHNELFVYNSVENESRAVRLKISYSNKKVSHPYPANSIVIEVPGIKKAVRSPSTAYIPIDGAVAADPMSSTKKTHDWSYSYSKSEDLFTFVNNYEIDNLTTFEGSFEIMWNLPSRETIHMYNGYVLNDEGVLTATEIEFDDAGVPQVPSIDFQATLTADSNTVTSNKLYYTQSRKKDAYTLTVTSHGIVDDYLAPVDLAGYTWVEYSVSAQDIYYARDVKGDERFELYFPIDAKVYGAGLERDENNKTLTDADKEKYGITDNKTYVCWYTTRDVTANHTEPYLEGIMVAYPADEYPVNKPSGEKTKLFVHGELYGTYYEWEVDPDGEHDNNGVSFLAWGDTSLVLDDYNYVDIPGPVYDVEKESFGIHNTFIDNYVKEHSNRYSVPNGGVNSLHLKNQEGTYYSELKIHLNYNRKWADSYDLEFYDDILDVLTKPDSEFGGEYRILNDDEYHFTSVTIPSNKKIANKSGGCWATGCEIEVWVRYAGEPYTKYEKYGDGFTLVGYDRKITFNRNDVVGVKVVFKDVTESVKRGTTMVRVDYVFHTDSTNILTDKGEIVNNMFFLLFGNKNGKRTWWNPFTKREYVGEETADEFLRDVERYKDLVIEPGLTLGEYSKGFELNELVGDRYKDYYYGDYDGKDLQFALDREKDELPIVEVPNSFRVYGTSIVKSDETTTTYEFNGSMTGEFTLMDDSTGITEFSLYTVIPEGLRLSEALNNDPELLKEVLRFSSSDNKTHAFLLSHVNIEIIENYRNSGRQYVKFNFDFSDSPIKSQWINISGIPMYVEKQTLIYGTSSITFGAGMIVHQEGTWTGTMADDYGIENGVWADLDGDNDYTEQASYNSNRLVFAYAEETLLSLTKFIETTLTNGPVRVDATKKDLTLDEVPLTYMGDEYKYILQAEVGSGTVNNIIFADVIEPVGDGVHKDLKGEWNGEFVKVDYSDMLNLLGCDESDVTVYYSAEEETFTPATDADGNIKDRVYVIDERIFEKETWIKEEDWELPLSEVRSVAVYFGGAAEATEGMTLSITITMKAPEKREFVGKIAKNSCNIGYMKVDPNGGEPIPEYLPSNVVPVRYTASGMIVVNKKDEKDGTMLTGAEFELYKVENGEITPVIRDNGGIFTVNKNNGRLLISDLEFGTYILKEVKAPKGYTEEGGLVVDTNGIPLPVMQIDGETFQYFVLDSNHKSVVVDYLNKRKDGTVKFQKISNMLATNLLEGAEFKLYKVESDGTVTQIMNGNDEVFVTGAKGILEISGLEWGDYYLTETKAPAGYDEPDPNNKITFTINAANDAGIDLGTVKVKNQQIPAAVTLTKYELKNDKYTLPDRPLTDEDIDTSVTVSGAIYELYRVIKDENGNVLSEARIDTRITGSNGRITIENLAFGDYYFIEAEDSPAKGYGVYKEKIEFTLDERYTEEEPLRLKTADPREKSSIHITKRDDTGAFVEGGKYQLYNANGEAIGVVLKNETDDGNYIYSPDSADRIYTMTTNKEGYIHIDEVLWGTYYIKEVEAPKGYKLDEEKHWVTIDRPNYEVMKTVDSTDDRLPGMVQLTKVDDKNPPTPITGSSATFDLYKDDGTLYKQNIETDKETGILTVTGLPWGGYYLLETKAPDGYKLSDKKIRFAVNQQTAGKLQYLSAENTQSFAELIVTKRIYKNEVVFAHGNPTFIFEAVRVDDGGNDKGHTYRRSVTFSGDLTPTADGFYEMTVVFLIPEGTYEVSEVSVNRYEMEMIYVGDKLQEGSKATVTLGASGDGEKVTVIFQNIKTDQEGTSDTAIHPNIIKKARKLTAVIADFNYTQDTNPVTKTDMTLEKLLKYLTVTAVYDDGSYEVLKQPQDIELPDYSIGEYSVTTDYDPTVAACYVITVSYAEGGVIRSDSFSVVCMTNGMFTWDFIKTQIDGQDESEVRVEKYDEKTVSAEDGIEYYGKVYIYGYLGTSPSINFPAYIVSTITDEEVEAGTYDEIYKGTLGKVYKVVQIGGGGSDTGHFAIDFPNIPSVTNINVNFAEGIETIANFAFNQNSISNAKLTGSLTIPSSVTKIGENAFNSCAGITYLTLSEGLEIIDRYAFTSCSGLDVKLQIPSTVTTIGAEAFRSCSKLKEELVIPDSVTSIGSGAFQNCGSITSLKLPDNDAFDTIEQYTFAQCMSLKSVEIPQNIKEIGNYAFNVCMQLNLTFAESDTPLTIGDSAFAMCVNLNSQSGGKLTIPNNVTKIGVNAFNNCQITSLDLGDRVESHLTEIKDNAFNACTSLRGNIVIPDSVTTIGSQIFLNCTGLSSGSYDLTIGNGLKTIASDRFFSSGQMPRAKFRNLTIGSGVEKIADNAFMNQIIFTGELIFEQDSQLTSIGKNAFRECGFTGNLTIPESVNEIKNEAFYGCGFNGSLTINYGNNPNTVTIGEGAFNKVRFTGTLDLTSVREIGQNAFYHDDVAPNSVKIKFGDKLTKIGPNAFYNPKATSSVEYSGNIILPPSLQEFGNMNFRSCAPGTTLFIPDTLQETINGLGNPPIVDAVIVYTVPKDKTPDDPDYYEDLLKKLSDKRVTSQFDEWPSWLPDTP